MPTAASIIEALQRRLRLSLRRDSPTPGQFPPGWQSWLESMRDQAGAITGATSDAMVAALAQRPLLAPPRRAQSLNRWQAFATLWRQQWQPPEREERGLRWAAGIVSLLWHILFGGLLIWLMYLQFFATRPPPEGENVTMIEYIGEGTPAEPGGGQQQPSDQPQTEPTPATAEPSPQPSQQAATAPSPPQVAVATPPPPELQAPLPEVAQRDVPEPQIPPPTVEQPVMVSKAVPDSPQIFVLPPTRKRVDDSLRVPQIEPSAQPLRTVEVPAPVQPPSRELPQREIALPSVTAQPREVAVREIPAPLPSLPVRELPTRPIETPQLRSATPQVRVAEIPTPSIPAPAPESSTPASAPTPTPSAQPDATATAAAPAATPAANAAANPSASSTSSTSPSTATRTPAATAGAGPKPTPAPGTWSTPKRGDDWGESTRNRPGAQRGDTPGLYNSDGSLRLADAPGSASPGKPPGTITEEIKDLDRAGTWLRRKPTDYEPTSLDKYWRPNETLLAEWVRRSVQTVMIPIPGTSKRIQCSVVLLMAGGGCGIDDPNLNEQPAQARPPPDIPFKKHLQEDNGSVRPPQGG
ncbi:hypothetical protein [Lysobacter sp. CA199]|uniref:hypothetical protein n=1 Tax=Lysobacter sp. CA199 TaxID=3455608 RepID=UPI003F8D3C1E